MANLYPVAGSKIFIGKVLNPGIDDLAVGDFTPAGDPSWIEIDGWQTMGAFGDMRVLIETDLINRDRTVGQKGTANAGNMQNNFAVISDDPGQLAFTAATNTKDNYEFMIKLSSGKNVAFAGLAMSNQAQGGEANTIQIAAMELKINSNIVELV